MTYLRIPTYSISFGLALLVQSAAAQDIDDRMTSDNTAYVGVSGVLLSEYLGSADEDFRVLPYLSVDNFKGFDFFGTALTYRLIDTGTGEGLGKWSLRAGPRIAYQTGRDSDDSSNLTGFEDVDGSLPIGGYIRSTLGPLGFRFDAGQDIIKGHNGFTADASVGTFYRIGNFAIQPSATVSWADGNHNESFFGVTANQSQSSNLAAFDIGSGIYAYSANVVTWIEIKDQYAVSLIATYRKFTGDAKDSPILRANDGATDGLYAAISVSKKFDLSKF